MTNREDELRAWFEREQVRPRQSVVRALDSLNLQPGDRIVDIGCGPGVHLRHMLERVEPGGTVVGIDTSRERLDIAASMLEQDIQRGAIQVVEGDMYALGPDLGTFDVVWMSLVLHHEDMPVDTIGHLRSLLKPGGRIAILDGDDAASFPFIPWSPAFELKIRRAVIDAADEKRFTARRVLSVLREAGMTDLDLRPYADIRRAPLSDWDREDIQSWFLTSFGSRIREHLSADEWNEYQAHFESGTSRYLLDRPDFFLIRTWYLATGRLPASA